MVLYLRDTNTNNCWAFAVALGQDADAIDNLINSDEWLEILSDQESNGVLDLDGEDKFVGYLSYEVPYNMFATIAKNFYDWFWAQGYHCGTIQFFPDESKMRVAF